MIFTIWVFALDSDSKWKGQFLRLVNFNHFWPFFCQLHKYVSQNLGADIHFEGLNISKFQLDQNLWHQSQIVLTSTNVFQFWKKKIENLSYKNGYFITISGHFFGNYINIFHKTEIQTVILRCLVCKNLYWIKSYNIVLIKIFFFSCLKMHFRASLPKWLWTPQKETSSCVYIWKWKKFQSCFTNSLCRLESVGKPKKLGRVINAAPNIMKAIIISLYPFRGSFNTSFPKIKVATGVQEKMAVALPRGTCWNATKTDKISKPPQNPCKNIWILKKIMFI